MDRIDQIIQDTIYANPNLKVIEQQRLEMVIKQINNLMNSYDVEMLLENSAALFASVSVEENKIEPDKSNRAFTYDLNRNVIIDNRRFVKDDSRRLYDYFDVVFDMVTKKFNSNTGTYDNGLITKFPNGNSFGMKINEKVKHTLITIMTGEVLNEEDIKDFYVDKVDDPCTLEDSLLIDINSFISASELLTYFINSEGELFYQKIASTLDNDDEKTIDFFFNIDKYCRENSIEHRKKYDEYIDLMRKNVIENTEENTVKIA